MYYEHFVYGSIYIRISGSIHSLLYVFPLLSMYVCFFTRTNNPVLLHFLLSLSGRLRDATVQDLILRTLTHCPDLLVPYLRSLSLNFEPKPSSEWMVNMAFLIKVRQQITFYSTLNFNFFCQGQRYTKQKNKACACKLFH